MPLAPPALPPSPRPHHVVMLAYPNAQVLDIVGPLELFGRAARWIRDQGLSPDLPYRVEIVAARPGPFATSSGMRLIAERGYRTVRSADTLLVAGGVGHTEAQADAALHKWLRAMSGKVTRLGSICNGALILAAAGLLSGRRATTHWAFLRDLQKILGAAVCDDAIYIRDGNRYTSAGVTAGMDMALAMLEEDWGTPVALAVARELVLFLKRPGGQSQFSDYLAAQFSENSALKGLQLWMLEHLAEDLSVARLAERAAMSPRNFARHFNHSVGVSPGQYVRQLRLNAARRKLEQTPLRMRQIAQRCGFGSEESLRRSFIAALGVSPAAYRERFEGAARELDKQAATGRSRLLLNGAASTRQTQPPRRGAQTR
jgi:transcriptional regulator GlxA family with amidase domain